MLSVKPQPVKSILIPSAGSRKKRRSITLNVREVEKKRLSEMFSGYFRGSTTTHTVAINVTEHPYELREEQKQAVQVIIMEYDKKLRRLELLQNEISDAAAEMVLASEEENETQFNFYLDILDDLIKKRDELYDDIPSEETVLANINRVVYPDETQWDTDDDKARATAEKNAELTGPDAEKMHYFYTRNLRPKEVYANWGHGTQKRSQEFYQYLNQINGYSNILQRTHGTSNSTESNPYEEIIKPPPPLLDFRYVWDSFSSVFSFWRPKGGKSKKRRTRKRRNSRCKI